jgi:hypothetical protein
MAYEVNSGTPTTWTRWQWGGWSAWQKTYPIDDAVLPARLRSLSPNYGDLNNINVNGWAYANGDANAPPGDSQWFVQTLMWGSSGYCTQVAHALSSETTYKRRQVAGTWQGWVQIYPVTDASLRPSLRTKASQAPGNDCNLATDNGWYWCESPCAHAPTTNWGWLQTIQGPYGPDGMQLFWGWTSGDGWQRQLQNGAWTAWVQTWPAGGGDSGWQNPYFSAGNASLGAPWGPVQFKKLASGLVVMRGLVGWDHVVASPANVIQVPAGYRPGINQLFNVTTSQAFQGQRLDVQTDGWLVLQANSPDAGGWTSVNEVSYMAEQ